MQNLNYFVLLSLCVSFYSTQLTPSDLNDTKYDFQKEIVNFNNFSYVINPEGRICSNEKVFLLVYVHTSPENYKRRVTIRETWSQKHLFTNVRIVFFTGLSLRTEANDMLKLESNLYKDIVQKSFVDTYRNLTLKSGI
jgi:hypothetical protein